MDSTAAGLLGYAAGVLTMAFLMALVALLEELAPPRPSPRRNHRCRMSDDNTPSPYVPLPQHLLEAPPPPPPPRAATATPLVPPKVALALAVLAALCAPAAGLLPFPYGAVAGVAALLCAFLAATPLAVPRWAAGKPLVPIAAVPAVASMAAMVVPLVEALPEGAWRAGGVVLVALLCALAGKAFPNTLAVRR